jgi:hypothetical protein
MSLLMSVVVIETQSDVLYTLLALFQCGVYHIFRKVYRVMANSGILLCLFSPLLCNDSTVNSCTGFEGGSPSLCFGMCHVSEYKHITIGHHLKSVGI